MVEGWAQADLAMLDQAPSPSATTFRVVSHLRWHGGEAVEPNRVRLFVGVLTGGANADRRAAIRETWGRDKRLHRWGPEAELFGKLPAFPGHLGLCGPENRFIGLSEMAAQGVNCPVETSLARSRRVLFFSAKPRDEGAFDALRREAADSGDVVVLPGVFESYHNITHQTLEILRAASMDPTATHALKVCCL
jgi:hypothetical protein